MDSGRLIIDPPASGAWNMAVDEVLLQAAEQHGQGTLRFYQWSEPTLSLGYFQAYAQRDAHLASQACPLVRRSTGGGAILHHIELTYSIARPLKKGAGLTTEQLYQAFHQTLIQVLADEFGVRASIFRAGQTAETDQPFLCFQRRAQGDVLMGQSKIAGSAQRRRRSAVLQHGSVLLGASKYAPQLPGIADIARIQLQAADLIRPWCRAIGNELDVSWRDSDLSGSELAAARDIQRCRFASSSWTKKR